MISVGSRTRLGHSCGLSASLPESGSEEDESDLAGLSVRVNTGGGLALSFVGEAVCSWSGDSSFPLRGDGSRDGPRVTTKGRPSNPLYRL